MYGAAAEGPQHSFAHSKSFLARREKRAMFARLREEDSSDSSGG